MPKPAELIALAALLMSLVALAIDFTLPALGDMAITFQLGANNQRQWIILSVVIGVTIGQFLFGPGSDVLGRRPMIFTGITVFIIGSLICSLADSQSPLFEIDSLARRWHALSRLP